VSELVVPPHASPAPRALDTLDPSAAERIGRAPSDNTLRAYGRWLANYKEWCKGRGIEPIPASAATFANYVSALADARKGVPTIRQAMAAVRWAHAVAGHEDEPPLKLARLALRDHAKQQAEMGIRGRGEATPILLPDLQAMLDTCAPDTLRGRRDRCLLVLGWAGMLRRSELAALTLADVREVSDGLTIYIAKSKTDKDAEGADVPLPRGSHPGSDPAAVHAAYVEALAEHGITSGRLFRGIDRGGRVDHEITGDQINDVVQDAAHRAKLTTASTRYSAHSLRAGGATAAYHNGSPVSVIAAHGRWAKNSPVVLGYIRAVDKWKDNPMRGIGL
jgi:integrase